MKEILGIIEKIIKFQDEPENYNPKQKKTITLPV